MQTHEWEALLNGTTPGPWFTNVGGFGRIESIGPISTGFSIGDGLDCDEDDAILAAYAPAAVAEVIRLRKTIAAVRDDYQRSAEVDSLLAQFSTVPLVPVFNDLADALTRILEGEA